jgi:hypothetical protein
MARSDALKAVANELPHYMPPRCMTVRVGDQPTGRWRLWATGTGTEAMDHEPARPTRPGRTALALIALGLPGIASLFLVLPPVAGVPAPLLVLNPLLLLVALALVGAWTAPHAKFVSRVAARASGLVIPCLPPGWLRLLAIGAGAGIAIALADHATRAVWQPAPLRPPSLVESWNLTATIVGLLYGGVVEEILMRWGLMSLFVLGAWKLLSRHAPAPPPAAIWTGIVLAALVFAAGHLPVLMASGAEIGTPLLFRTFFWNGALGILFGWLYAARDLESAMLAHAGFHIGLVPVGLAMVAVAL